MNIPTLFEANLCSSFGELVENMKSLRRGQRTQHDRYRHTHSVTHSVTKNQNKAS